MKIFQDNDGCLANFDLHVYNLFGKYPSEMTDPQLWALVDSNPDFWLDMPPMPDAYILWDFLVSTGIEFSVLTGCPKTNYDLAAAHKPLWIKKHFGDVEVITCLSKNKPMHMQNPGDILIDDFMSNVKRWEKAGGIAIRHYNAERTIEKLKNILDIDKKRLDE